MITLLRVDHRLLHGQVAFSWTQYVGADCILIANDSVPGDELRKTTIKLAKPPSVKLVMRAQADGYFSEHDDDPSLCTQLRAEQDAKRVFKLYSKPAPAAAPKPARRGPPR